MMKGLPEIRAIKDTRELKIGDVLVYTGNPRGTGVVVPEVGTLWMLIKEAALTWAAIEIIERGRGWQPVANNAGYEWLRNHPEGRSDVPIPEFYLKDEEE